MLSGFDVKTMTEPVCVAELIKMYQELMNEEKLDGMSSSELEKDHWEFFAKRILEEAFPDRFMGLELGESPDLRNGVLGVGIGVTSAEDFEMKKRDSLYFRKYLCGKEEERKNARGYIEKTGGIITEHGLSHPVFFRELSGIYNAISVKTKKLNTNYDKLRYNGLFVFNIMIILDAELSTVLEEIIKIEKKKEYRVAFDEIFIYCYGGDIIDFDVRNRKIKRIHLSTKLVNEISKESICAVKKNDNNEK